MIDLHCHILPGLDDGSRSAAMSLAMARTAAESGTQHIVCTPHCTAGSDTLPERIRQVRLLVPDLNRMLTRQSIPLTLHTGMELLCTPGLEETLARGEYLTLNDTRYLLVEFDFDAPFDFIAYCLHLVRRSGLVPVLAHPERYEAVKAQPDCMAYWFREEKCLLQLDSDSVVGRFGPRCSMAAHWALRHGVAHAIASDAHSPHSRSPELAAAAHMVARDYSPDYAQVLLLRNPRRILQGRPVLSPEEI